MLYYYGIRLFEKQLEIKVNLFVLEAQSPLRFLGLLKRINFNFNITNLKKNTALKEGRNMQQISFSFNFLGSARFLEFLRRFIWGFIWKVLPFWVLFFLFTLFILNHIWEDPTPPIWVTLAICIIVYWSTINSFMLEVVPNSCQTTKNTLFGNKAAYWPGFNWISILEKPFRLVDTSKHNTTKRKGDWDCTDDKVVGEWKVLWRPDIRNVNTRDENMIKYVETTEANIESDIDLTVNLLMTAFCLPRTSESAKNDQQVALTTGNLQNEELCWRYGLEVVNSGLEDLDYSKETEEARKAKKAMNEFQLAVNNLMQSATNPHGCKTVEQAQKIVKAKMLGGNYKEIEISNPTGVPVVVNP